MIEIKDSFGRTFNTLRVSLTNVCNLACVYCVDPAGTSENTTSPLLKKSLSTEEYIKIIKALHTALGLETIRLTGGEPTLYKDLCPLVEGISQLNIPEIKMTSNGFLMGNKASALKKAGLTSVNISLDAIDADAFFAITRRRNLQQVLNGIEKSIDEGIKVKINCVVMRGKNDNQVIPLLEYCHERNIPIRFLELMQMGHLYHNFNKLFFSEADILNSISDLYNIRPIERKENATSKYWRMDDGFEFGIISNESDPFCNDCNRLRLDSYGNIFGCLSDDSAINISECIDDPEAVNQKLQLALAQKKMKFSGSALSMLHIGG